MRFPTITFKLKMERIHFCKICPSCSKTAKTEPLQKGHSAGTELKKSVANLGSCRRSTVRILFDSISIDVMSFIYWRIIPSMHYVKIQPSFFLLHTCGTDSKTNLFPAAEEYRWSSGPVPRNIIWKLCENKESEPQKIK